MPLFGSILSHARPHEKDGKPLEHWSELENNKSIEHIATITTHGDKPHVDDKTREYWVPSDDQFYKTHLSRKEYDVMRQRGTERPRSSIYDKFYPTTGYFACKACGLPLYSYRTKFDSGTGWPSFGAHVQDNVTTRPHFTGGFRREEVVCRRCQSHLGHVFAEYNTHHFDRLETFTERQCVNGISLKYIKDPLETTVSTKATLL